ADSLEVPLLGQIPIVEQFREHGDEGKPVTAAGESEIASAFSALAATVAQQVAIRNSKLPPTAQVEMQVQ
ncbi:MAG: MRP family ATP-binding protein, partial [Bacteroidota bacterium]